MSLRLVAEIIIILRAVCVTIFVISSVFHDFLKVNLKISAIPISMISVTIIRNIKPQT